MWMTHEIKEKGTILFFRILLKIILTIQKSTKVNLLSSKFSIIGTSKQMVLNSELDDLQVHKCFVCRRNGMIVAQQWLVRVGDFGGQNSGSGGGEDLLVCKFFFLGQDSRWRLPLMVANVY